MGLFSAKPDLIKLEERIEKLERGQRALEGEWITWYEKAQKMLWRLVKRAEATREDPDPSPPADSAPASRVDPITAKILARRGRGVLPG